MVHIIDGWEVGIDPRHITSYHRTRDCRALDKSDNEPIEVTREDAERRGLTACEYCIGDIEYEDTECPLCGDIVRDTKLPEHIRWDCDKADEAAVSD